MQLSGLPVRAVFHSLVLAASLLVAGIGAQAIAGPGDDDVMEFDAPDAPDDIDVPEVDVPEAETVEIEEAVAEAPETAEASNADQQELAEGNSGPSGDDAPDSMSDSEGGGSSDDGGSDGAGEDDPAQDDRSGSGHGGGGEDHSFADNSGSHSGSNSGSDHGSPHSGSPSGSSDGSGTSGRDSSGQGGGGTADAHDLIMRHLSGPIEITRDDLGREYLAGEVLMSGATTDVARAVASGYHLISEQRLGSEDRFMARLLVPGALSVDEAIRDLQTLAPLAIITINTAYRTTQAARFTPAAASPVRRPMGPSVLGVIDTGVDPATFAASNVLVASRGFGPAGYLPRQHGSAVASIAADMGVRVQVADVFGASAGGEPVASASAIVAALQWMLDAEVAVINISIEGPENEIIEQLVGEAARNGHVIVAAAGNGGPLDDPAFPGAYEGVLAVTAVDRTGHAYRHANRGDYIDFAALGVDVPVRVGDEYATVTGTSFASPVVAAEIAKALQHPSAAEAARVIAHLRQRAIDHGRPGRDPVYGWGEVRLN